MESMEESMKSLCRRVKKSLRLLHGVDTCKPAEGGINESGFKALFLGALAEDSYHVESEFKLGSSYADLLLTRRDAPFDVAVVVDLKYCATPFIASKHFDNAHRDPKQLEALKKLSVLDVCKLKMFWSKGYEAVSVKTVLVAAKKQTNAFAESLLATGMFPFVLSVTVVGIGPCLVTKIETLGRVRPLLVPSPQTLFPHSHADLARLQHRMRVALSCFRSTDGDVDWKHGFKSGVTLTGLKLAMLGALHDSAFFVGSAVNMQPAKRGRRSRRRDLLEDARRGRSRSRSSSSSSSRSSSASSSSSSSSRSSSGSRSPRRHHHRHGRRARSASPSSASSSSSRSRSRSRSHSRSSSRSRSYSPDATPRTTSVTGRDGVTYNVRNESLGTIHLLLFNERHAPSHAVVVHFKYFPINDVHEWNAATGAFERFGDQFFDNDKFKHKRRLYLSEGLRRLSALSREELERVYVKNPAALEDAGASSVAAAAHAGDKVDTVGSIARAYTSLAFRQSQAVLEKFPSVRSCTSVSVIGVGSALLWLQEEVAPTPFSLDALKTQLLHVERQEDLGALARKYPRKRGQSERVYEEYLRDLAARRERKRREKMAQHARAQSLDRHYGHHNHRSHGYGHHDAMAASAAVAASSSGPPADLIALLAERHHQRQSASFGGTGGGRRGNGRSRSQQRNGGGRLNRSAYW